MRWNLLFFAALFSSSFLNAQPGVNYQAAVRDAQGAIMANTNVSITITLTDGENGPVLYQETHATMSNELGLINLIIGEGTVDQGTYAAITGVQDLNIGIEAQVGDGPDIVDVGFTKVGAVPFALYGEDADADPANEMQSLSLENDTLKIEGGMGVSIEAVKTPFVKTDSSYVLDFSAFPPPENNRSLTENAAFNFTRKNLDWTDLQEGESIRGSFGMLGLSWANEARTIGLDVNYLFGDRNAINLTSSWTDDTKNPTPQFNILGQDNVRTTLEPGWSSYMVGNMQISHGIFELTGSESDRVSSVINSFADQNQEYGIIRLSNFETDNITLGSQYFYRSTDDTAWGAYGESASGLNLVKRFTTDNSKAAIIDTSGISVFDIGIDHSESTNFFDLFNSAGDFSLGGLGSRTGGTYSTGSSDGFSLFGSFPNSSNGNQWIGLASEQNFFYLTSINNELAGFSTLNGADGFRNWQMNTFQGAANCPAELFFPPDDAPFDAANYITVQGNDHVSISMWDQFVNSAPVPGRSDQMIAYGSLSGPEMASYDRGTATLINGEAYVECPDHFQWMADPNSMTVTLTPLSASSKGLAVIEKTTTGFRVKELHEGTGSYDFDYMVTCKRKGYQGHQIIQQRPQVAESAELEIQTKLSGKKMKSINDLIQN